DREHLPEFALGVRSLDHCELAIQHPHIARGILWCLEEGMIDLALAVDPPGRMSIVTLAKVPSGMSSPVFCGSASFMSNMVVILCWVGSSCGAARRGRAAR